MCSDRNSPTTRIVYRPRLVRVRFIPRIGASRLISFVTSNWSSGDDTKNVCSICVYVACFVKVLYILLNKHLTAQSWIKVLCTGRYMFA